jgi:hypothetical protein
MNYKWTNGLTSNKLLDILSLYVWWNFYLLITKNAFKNDTYVEKSTKNNKWVGPGTKTVN